MSSNFGDQLERQVGGLLDRIPGYRGYRSKEDRRDADRRVREHVVTVFTAEADLAEFAAQQEFPIIPCDLCGSQEQLRRKQIKRLLTDLEAENPLVRRNLLAALGNVRPTHLLDASLRRKLGLLDASE